MVSSHNISIFSWSFENVSNDLFCFSFIIICRNFVRVSSGPELGAYYHEFFVRDQPHLAAQMFCKNARSKAAMADESLPQPQAALPLPAASMQTPSAVASGVLEPTPIAEPMMPQSNAQQMPVVPPKPTGYNIPDFVLQALRKEGEGEGDAALSMTAAPTLGVGNLQLLERQIQIMQEEHQRLLLRQMAARQLQEQQLQEQLQRQCNIQDPRQQQQQQQGKPSAQDILRMQQLMELRNRQRKGLVPTNGRASAA